MFMCECSLCIYNENEECTLIEIGITSTGFCEDCVFPSFNGAVLEKAKRKTLDEVEGAYIKMIKDPYVND